MSRLTVKLFHSKFCDQYLSNAKQIEFPTNRTVLESPFKLFNFEIDNVVTYETKV